MIKVEGLRKNFGKNVVLNNINTEFAAQQIHGIIGRNGSGKTVMLKCLCGLMEPSDGTVRINGILLKDDVQKNTFIGAIIETPGFIPTSSGYRNLKFLSALGESLDENSIKETMKTVGLDPESKKHVSHYSLGMKQRLGIAQAIMGKPKLLILDEPMNGLDNDGVEQIRRLFLKLKKDGATILLACHSKDDISALCDTVTELDKGTIVKRHYGTYCPIVCGKITDTDPY